MKDRLEVVVAEHLGATAGGRVVGSGDVRDVLGELLAEGAGHERVGLRVDLLRVGVKVARRVRRHFSAWLGRKYSALAE